MQIDMDKMHLKIYSVFCFSFCLFSLLQTRGCHIASVLLGIWLVSCLMKCIKLKSEIELSKKIF